MILTIRTDSPVTELAIYSPDGGSLLASETWESGRELARSLLAHVGALCVTSGGSIQKLTGIVCFLGPGSFTGLRIGATTVNALAYGLSVPVVGTSGDDWAKEGCQRLPANENDKVILPEYGAEANITAPRK
jgi:tRNA threonylcarbamoyladenosine biosynthesis protein TsaB